MKSAYCDTLICHMILRTKSTKDARYTDSFEVIMLHCRIWVWSCRYESADVEAAVISTEARHGHLISRLLFGRPRRTCSTAKSRSISIRTLKTTRLYMHRAAER